VLEDAVVSSKSNFLIAGGRAVLDYQADELEQVPWDFEMDPIAFGAAPDSITALVESGGVSGRRLEQGLPLVGLNTFNYWHWLVEYLPRVLDWRGEPGFDALPLIVDEAMPPQFLEALHLFAGREGPIVVLKRGEAVRVERLWTSAMPINLPHWPSAGEVPPGALTVLDADAFAQQLHKLDPQLDRLGGGGGAKRVYLRRPAERFRGIVNNEKVEDWFAEQGFELVEMSDLGFLDQVSLIRGAEVVVGPNGSALTNTLLARRGTRVGVLDNRYVEDNHWYAAMCEALEQPLGYLLGEVVADDERYSWNASYRIDVAMLPAFLDSLLSVA
jgi:capsular polysaccharide biosynthesis protein